MTVEKKTVAEVATGPDYVGVARFVPGLYDSNTGALQLLHL